jgi:polyribonucleotide nucleotidyltransferase
MSHTISLDINGRTLSIEIGKIARQADGSALVRYGDTIMLVTATSKKEVKEPKPFLPLIVDYRENTYAAGKIPGGFFKREGRPSEREILEARLIDRPIRPLFPEGYFFDTQVVGLLLSADLENEPDTLGVIGASAALYFSSIPFTTPIGAVKIGLVDGAFVINPTATQLVSSPLNMTVVGTEDGVVMIEAGAKEVEEERLIEAITLAHETIRRIVQAQKDLFVTLGIKKREFTPRTPNAELRARIEGEISTALLEAIQIKDKLQSEAAVKKILEALLLAVPADTPEVAQETKDIFYALEEKIVRDFILSQGKRTDGRRFDEVRPITIEVGQLPRTHGSAVFTRGETQSLATVTLGTVEDAQRLDNLGEDTRKRFMLHYNFPPFSVGEVNFLRGPGRREIGHGALAEKGILPSIPDDTAFPYTIRIVSDILESNGSSSMATVCGGVLALMDAGVPLKIIVAGVAMGMISDGGRHAVLTDIAGLEDHFGDMDFKVIGSEKGVTAIQMDLKIKSVTPELLREAFAQSRQARLHVLGRMKEALAAPRPDISPFAPLIFTVFVNPERISEVIGPAGKVVKKIVAMTGAKIDIEDDGKITIASADVAAAEKAMQMIRDITAEAEIGKSYTGKVIRLEEYGAFVEILPNVVGLLHISEVAPYRIKSIRDVIQLGQDLTVKCITIDEDRKVRVSLKALADPNAPVPPGEAGQAPPAGDHRPPYRDRGPRDRDRGRRNRY